MEKDIAKLEKEIAEESDPDKKKNKELRLEEVKEFLAKIKKRDQNIMDEFKDSLGYLKQMALMFKPYAKFEGSFNTEKTNLTIKGYPVYDGKK